MENLRRLKVIVNMDDELRWPMHADNLAVLADYEQDLELKLERWREEFENNGLKVNKEKKSFASW